MGDLLSSTTQVLVVIATAIEVLAWCAMAWAMRYYAPYRRRDE